MPIARGGAQTRRLPQTDARHVRDADDEAVAIGDRRLRQIVDGLRKGICPNDQTLASTLDESGTCLDIGTFKRLHEITQAEAVGCQLFGIRADGIFLDIATDRVDARKPRSRAHLRRNDPVLHSAQVGGTLLWRREAVAFRRQIDLVGLPTRFVRLTDVRRIERREIHRPHQYFAQTRGHRRHHRRHPFGQLLLHFAHAFGHLLACEVDVGLVGENGGDLGESVT